MRNRNRFSVVLLGSDRAGLKMLARAKGKPESSIVRQLIRDAVRRSSEVAHANPR